MRQSSAPYWNLPADEVLKQLNISNNGLSETEAQSRLESYGANILKPRRRTDNLTLLARQFTSPLILILIVTAVASFFLGGASSSIIVLVIVFISGILGFWQERGSTNAIQRLLNLVRLTATVIRDQIPFRPAKILRETLLNLCYDRGYIYIE